MSVGERAEIEIPPEYAYGTEGYPPVYPFKQAFDNRCIMTPKTTCSKTLQSINYMYMFHFIRALRDFNGIYHFTVRSEVIRDLRS